MGHSVLSQGIVMSASPSIRLSEVLSPPQQRVSAAPQSLPSRPCSCGSFFFFQRGARGHLEVTASRGGSNLFNSEWAALGRVKNANWSLGLSRLSHFFLHSSPSSSFFGELEMKNALGDTGTTMCLILRKEFQITSELSGAMLKKQRSERKKRALPQTYGPQHPSVRLKKWSLEKKKKVELEPI